MANYFEKIAVIIDVTSDKAVAGLKTFRKSVAEAEGFSGKFKAGIGSLKESLGGMMSGASGPAAIAAGATAIGAAWMKAGQTFIDTARQARDLSVATGLGIEDASRLIEVFGDLGGDASTLAQSIGKITRSLDDDKWTKYGIATRDASGQARDANDIFLESLEVIRQIKDPTERAAAGAALYGKSWANLAPLVAKSDKELRSALKSVKDGKVITEDEADKADKLAEGFDNIKDAVEEMVLGAGEALVAMKPIFDVVALTLEAIAYDIGLVMDAWDFFFGEDPAAPLGEIAHQARGAAAAMRVLEQQVTPTAASVVEFGDANKYAAEQAFIAAQKAAELERKLANKRGGIAFAAKEAQTAIENMMGAISEDREWIAIQLELDGLKERLDDIKQRYDDDEIDMREYYLLTREEILKTKESLLGFITELEGMSPYLKQKILFEFDRGNAEGVVKLIEAFFAGEKVEISTVLKTPVGMPWIPGGTGPKDGAYGSGVVFNVNIGVAGNPMETGRTIVRLVNDYYSATGQGLNPGPR